MSDWTYEPLILKLKEVLAEAEGDAERSAPPVRTAPRAIAGATPRRDGEPDLQRS